MNTQPKWPRIQSVSDRSRSAMIVAVVALVSVVINGLGRLNKKPYQIQHKYTDSVECGLIYNVASCDAGEIENHAADHILNVDNEWQYGALKGPKKTHNKYSTTKLVKINHPNKIEINTFQPQLQSPKVAFTENLHRWET